VPSRGNGLARDLFTPLPRHYDRLAEVLSLGQNRRWRAEMVAHVVEAAPGLVLSVACGTAGECMAIAQGSGARVVGVDLTEAMLRRGQDNLARAGLAQRAQLLLGQAEKLPFPDATFDGLSFTYLLRYVEDPQATLNELARVIRPGGVAASLEFFVPPRHLWRAGWGVYTRALLPAAGMLLGGKDWYRVGRFLGPSITSHYCRYPLGWTLKAWERAGFTAVGTRLLSLGGGLVMWGRRGE
jgi:demethylmenaquinone methyltransferase/2-methoxy-6-polyprenyl-1,4-benzoquinol methylase